nr:PREDICTED: uncharacterized protein LOC109640816 [Paralichthys olivaceus]
MAASMCRMNWLWRRMAGVLVLCALLLSNEVICQEDATVEPPAISDANPTSGANAATDAAAPDAVTPDAAAPDAAAPGVSAAPTAADPATAAGQDAAASGAPLSPTIIIIAANPDSMDTSGSTVAPSDSNNNGVAPIEVVHLMLPEVKCVGKDVIPEGNAVKAVVATDDCEATKQIILSNPAGWCHSKNCNLEIFQDGNNVLVASDDAKLKTLAEALQSEHLKDKLGVTKIETPSSSGSSVFVGILVTGLLAALAITVGYFKCQRRADPKGVRLAEEAYPVDPENQGNTLVSVAPLNPPPETQEKPSVNGESPEPAKTEPAPPPTNGHSTAKTADTEL